jgi:TonB family protein
MNSKKLAASTSKADIGLTPVATFVLWSGCLVVGVIGIRDSGLGIRTPAPPPIRAEVLNVEVTTETPPPASPPPANHPPPAASNSPPPAPAVAAPSPAIAFAAPTNKPVYQPPATATPTVVRLTFGQGEGQQPEPEYPIEDQLAGHEGSVGISMTVDEDGRVKNAEVESRSPWPTLNQAALRSVLQTWRFRPGPVRHYSVTITYQMKNSN